LLLYYRQKQAENGAAVDGRSDHRLQLCATQRLMQALGLMRSFGLVKGHENFLQYIPSAVRSFTGHGRED